MNMENNRIKINNKTKMIHGNYSNVRICNTKHDMNCHIQLNKCNMKYPRKLAHKFYESIIYVKLVEI